MKKVEHATRKENTQIFLLNTSYEKRSWKTGMYVFGDYRRFEGVREQEIKKPSVLRSFMKKIIVQFALYINFCATMCW